MGSPRESVSEVEMEGCVPSFTSACTVEDMEPIVNSTVACPFELVLLVPEESWPSPDDTENATLIPEAGEVEWFRFSVLP